MARRSRRASSSSSEKEGRCASYSTAATCLARCGSGAVGDDLEGGPPGARGCDVLAFEARVAALLGGAASFDEACGNDPLLFPKCCCT